MKLISCTILATLAALVSATPLKEATLDAGLEARNLASEFDFPELVARGGTGRPYGNATKEFCEKKHLIYNPVSGYCFNPARHPSEKNCAYLGKKYNSQTKKCYGKSGSGRPHGNQSKEFCQKKGLLFNPKSGYCYNPARHPSPANCAYFGLAYDSKTKKCYSPHDNPNPESCACIGLVYDYKTKKCVKPRNPKHCPKGQYPVVGQWKKCASCGWCKPYHSGGYPACTPSGECTLICPWGQHVKQHHGLVWCE